MMYPDSFHQNSTLSPPPAPEALTALHEYLCGLGMSKHRSLKLCALSIQALGQIRLTSTKVILYLSPAELPQTKAALILSLFCFCFP